MTNTAEMAAPVADYEFVSFRVGGSLLGVDVRQVEEINRCIDMTRVPGVCCHVRGVINLRGEVVTVIDLGQVLGLPPAKITKQTRIVVMRSKGEQIGLMVDNIVDVIRARADEIAPPPANVGGMEGRYFHGIHKLESDLLVVLDVNAVLTKEPHRH